MLSDTFVVIGYELTDGRLGSVRLAEEREGVLHPPAVSGQASQSRVHANSSASSTRLFGKPPITGLRTRASSGRSLRSRSKWGTAVERQTEIFVHAETLRRFE